jgi:hypothetical protein
MTLDAGNVRVGVGGQLMSSKTGAAPVDATAAWGTGWTDHGFLSEDGVEEAYNDDTTEIKAWQGGAIVRSMITGSEATLHFTMLETNKANLELYHKGSTVATASGVHTLDVMAAAPDRRKFGLDVVDGDEVIRLYVEDGEVKERGNIVYKGDEAIGYEVTVTCYPVDGVVVRKISESDSWA